MTDFTIVNEDQINIQLGGSSLEIQLSKELLNIEIDGAKKLELGIELNPTPSGVTEEDVLTLIRSENVFANYKTQQYDEATGVSYVGKVKTSGEWLISKIDDLNPDLTVNYANESNNVTMISFNLAWTNRAVLNYTLISNLTNL